MQHIGISVDGYAVTASMLMITTIALIGQDPAGQPIEKSSLNRIVEPLCI
jgi:hypothetical protein